MNRWPLINVFIPFSLWHAMRDVDGTGQQWEYICIFRFALYITRVEQLTRIWRQHKLVELCRGPATESPSLRFNSTLFSFIHSFRMIFTHCGFWQNTFRNERKSSHWPWWKLDADAISGRTHTQAIHGILDFFFVVVVAALTSYHSFRIPAPANIWISSKCERTRNRKTIEKKYHNNIEEEKITISIWKVRVTVHMKSNWSLLELDVAWIKQKSN